MPERDAWQALCEAARAGQRERVDNQITEIRAVLRRRARGEVLPTEDVYPEEHRLAPHPPWGAAWNAYKQAVRENDFRTARDRVDTLAKLIGENP